MRTSMKPIIIITMVMIITVTSIIVMSMIIITIITTIMNKSINQKWFAMKNIPLLDGCINRHRNPHLDGFAGAVS